VSTKTVLARSEIPVAHTWDVGSVFDSNAAWESEFKRVAEELDGLARFHGQLGASPDALAEWLEMADRLQNAVMRIWRQRSV
jgi:oligoendopeptidase F